jgi:membrane-associated phospholipid phosphatase
VSIGFVLVGLLVLKIGGAPDPLVALVAAMEAGLATSLLVTLFWKVSVHAAVVAGAEAILVLDSGPWLLVFTPIVLLVAWARVQLGHHTIAQVAAGVALGAAVAIGVFTALT